MRTLPLTDAKAHLSDLVESVSTTHEAVTITRHGYPAAVILSSDEFESIRETLAWAGEPDIEADLAETEADIAEGRTVSVDLVRASLRRGRQ